LSGDDLFALLSPEGRIDASFNNGAPLSQKNLESALRASIDAPGSPRLLASDGKLFEISSQPFTFGSGRQTTGLGYVTIGYALDDRIAREVSEAAAAEVVFAVDGRVVAGTLPAALRQELVSTQGELLRQPRANREMLLGRERYLASSIQLQALNSSSGAIQLVVFKSFAEEQQILAHLNRLVAALGVLAAVFGVGLAVFISQTVTKPLESLLAGTRALSRGDFTHQVREGGAEEVRELTRAFDRMRERMQRTQQELLAAERMATIGQMASSVSHDLRHYLSAIYANAEFLANPEIPAPEREEMLADVRAGVQGMTDMLDSLLVFSRTGMVLQLRPEYLAALVEQAVAAIRSHPDARGVDLKVRPVLPLLVEVDPKELRRAVYNLLLNACQAVSRGDRPAWVSIETSMSPDGLHVTVRDSGPGVPEGIRETLFHPFVSEGKHSGVGLGLALAKRIAEAHGGSIRLQESGGGNTAFTITLPRERILEEAARPAAQKR
jgi:signal transduction histidine kinase